jgi:4-hydroxy-3-polyprenylbenzoate decarboxylase
MNLPDQRAALDFCESEGELITVDSEVDPIYEMAAIAKSFDGGPALLFNNVKGHPDWRAVTNVLGRRERIAGMFGTSAEALPQRILAATTAPIPHELTRAAPCQENVVTEGINVADTLPIMKQTRIDVGPVISGGIVMVEYPPELADAAGSFNLSFHRLYAGLGRDWTTLATLYNRHFLEVLYHHKTRGQEFPLTINLGTSPGVSVLASGGAFPQIRTVGNDDLGIAGNLQESPVRICRARTVDAYAIADAEVVLEGKINYQEKVREDQGLDKGSPGKNYFFPEFLGYQGIAERAFKFEVSAITFRNRPQYYTPLADSCESSHLGSLITMASIFHACRAAAPNVFLNCNVLDGMRGILGVVIQCKVGHVLQQGTSQRLISAAFGAVKDLKWAITVDEDVDIFDPSDVLWAITTRTQADEDINIIKGTGVGMFSSQWSVDTTVPLEHKYRTLRPSFDEVDLRQWLSEEDIRRGRALMNEGALSIARRRV